MGNAGGKEYDAEGSSGVKDAVGFEQKDAEFAPHGLGAHIGYHAQAAYADAEAMLHSPPLSPGIYQQPPLMFNPQLPVLSARPGQLVPARNDASSHITTDFRDVFSEKPIPVLIEWSYGGRQVAVTGSWDNWNRSESLQRSDKDFVLIKMLPSGVYHYRFIVDERLTYDPDLPLELDDSGMACNVLDVQEHTPEDLGSLSEFQTPSSPLSTYNNEALTDDDLSKHPPDLPPQLQLAPPQLKSTLPYEGSSAMDGQGSLPRPRYEMLNHLYIQRRNDSGGNHSSSDRLPVALASTHRFHQKYVTVVMYKPKRR